MEKFSSSKKNNLKKKSEKILKVIVKIDWFGFCFYCFLLLSEDTMAPFNEIEYFHKTINNYEIFVGIIFISYRKFLNLFF